MEWHEMRPLHQLYLQTACKESSTKTRVNWQCIKGGTAHQSLPCEDLASRDAQVRPDLYGF
eukprot:4264193-Pleurochrysis_carterae.AAC.1